MGSISWSRMAFTFWHLSKSVKFGLESMNANCVSIIFWVSRNGSGRGALHSKGDGHTHGLGSDEEMMGDDKRRRASIIFWDG